MRINRTLGTRAKLRWLPAIKAPCSINVRASGQGRPQRPVMRGVIHFSSGLEKSIDFSTFLSKRGNYEIIRTSCYHVKRSI